MQHLKTSKWAGVVACLAGTILLVMAHTSAAQEVRVGGVSISIPTRPKTPKTEKPADKVQTAPADSSGARTESGVVRGPAPATTQSRAQSDPWLDIILGEIDKRKKEVESYDPSQRSQLVTPSTPELFKPAISRRAREKYYAQEKVNEARRSALDPALDSLAAAAAKKLPQYKPDPSVFAFHNPPAEQLMVRSRANGAALKVHQSGIKEAGWIIEKNDFGIPIDRYKHGFIWARDAGDDHPYCHLYTVYVLQNYEGGGTYGQTWAKPFDDEIVGCP
jgi:hypothetical protein